MQERGSFVASHSSVKLLQSLQHAGGAIRRPGVPTKGRSVENVTPSEAFPERARGRHGATGIDAGGQEPVELSVAADPVRREVVLGDLSADTVWKNGGRS